MKCIKCGKSISEQSYENNAGRCRSCRSSDKKLSKGIINWMDNFMANK